MNGNGENPFEGLMYPDGALVPFVRGPDVDGHPSWSSVVRNPFMVQEENGSITFLRPPADDAYVVETRAGIIEGEQKLYLRILANSFSGLYRGGNDKAHYVHGENGTEKGWYNTEERGVVFDDWVRHLEGVEPSLLSIPILPNGNTHFCDGDVDFHKANDVPVDYVAVARRIAELGLPLVLTRSRRDGGAHLSLFFLEKDGVPAPVARALMAHYMDKLGLSGEVFPKQKDAPDKLGSGVNLCYFGTSRVAFGDDGQELSLMEFLKLAAKRRSYGLVLAGNLPSADVPGSAPKDKEDRPLPIQVIFSIHLKNLQALRDSNHTGHWNDTLNDCFYWAGRAFAAHVLTDEKWIKDEIRKAAQPDAKSENEYTSTASSGWESGLKRPLIVAESEEAKAEAGPKIQEWLADKIELSNNEVYAWLAVLPEEQYEVGSLREDCAKKLGIKKVSKLDEFVRKRREKKADSKSGKVTEIVDVEPWPEPVKLETLLDEIVQVFKDYIVFQGVHDPFTLALWCVFSYVVDLFNIATYVGVSAASRGCGKTSLMRILLYLVRKPKGTISLTESVAFHIINEFHPTLIADEVDKWLARNPELLAIFTGGHEREFGTVDRMEMRNDVWVACAYDCFGAKAWGQIGLPDDQLVSRSLVIMLRAKKADEKTKKWPKVGMPAELKDMFLRLRRQSRRWAQDNVQALKDSKPEIADLINRSEDNWYGLLCIAKLAGDTWEKRALAAAGVEAVSEPEEGIVLLRDIRNIFAARKTDRIRSSTLLSDLLRQEESPWPKYNKQDGLTLYQLGKMLRAMQIKSGNVRLKRQANFDASKDEQAKGYRLDQFQDLFDRQLAGEPVDADVRLGDSSL
jgi:hypothetical protein